MHHESHAHRGGFTGVGALMDPGFLRDVAHQDDQPANEPHSEMRASATAVVERTVAWLTALFHRIG